MLVLAIVHEFLGLDADKELAMAEVARSPLFVLRLFKVKAHTAKTPLLHSGSLLACPREARS